MNNKHLVSLFCIIVLSIVPGCKKRQDKTLVEKVKTMMNIEDSAAVETVETTTTKSIVKF